MTETILARARRRFGIAAAIVAGLAAAWWASPGVPVIWGPHAGAADRAAGRALFLHEWEPRDALAHADGLGPVFNERSCVACHSQGGVGGGGGNDHNVTAFQVLPTHERPDLEMGLIHKFAVLDPLRESHDHLQRLFPITSTTVVLNNGCTILVRDFNPIKIEHINTSALFGAGWIDRIDRKAILKAHRDRALANVGREMRGEFQGIPSGRPRMLPDGRLGKFGWKGQFATLREFVAAACANEIGLGNPLMPQAMPRSEVALVALETKPDLDESQFRSLVAFVDTLPRPEQRLPLDAGERRVIERGGELFREIGCATCHTPDVGGVRGVYSDFLLHSLADRSESSRYDISEQLGASVPEDQPRPDEWKTPPLWGVADSAPYMHDGGALTLDAAIFRHKGSATRVTEAFLALDRPDAEALLAFLRSLRAPQAAEPAPQTESPNVAIK